MSGCMIHGRDVWLDTVKSQWGRFYRFKKEKFMGRKQDRDLDEEDCSEQLSPRAHGLLSSDEDTG